MSQIVVSALHEDYGTPIRAVVLCATLIYELVGPLLTKFVLTKAGEIVAHEKVSARDEAWKILSKFHLDHPHDHHSRHFYREADKKKNEADKKDK